jgi:hypothetical protein
VPCGSAVGVYAGRSWGGRHLPGLGREQGHGALRQVLDVTDPQSRALRGARHRSPRRHNHRLGGHPGGRPGPCSRWRPRTRTGSAGRPAIEPGTRPPLGRGRRRSRKTTLLEVPLSAPSARTKPSSLRVLNAVQGGPHHHHNQRPVDPAAPLQQAGEERPGPQLGMRKLQTPNRRAQQAGSVPVALRQPLIRHALNEQRIATTIRPDQCEPSRRPRGPLVQPASQTRPSRSRAS